MPPAPLSPAQCSRNAWAGNAGGQTSRREGNKVERHMRVGCKRTAQRKQTKHIKHNTKGGNKFGNKTRPAARQCVAAIARAPLAMQPSMAARRPRSSVDAGSTPTTHDVIGVVVRAMARSVETDMPLWDIGPHRLGSCPITPVWPPRHYCSCRAFVISWSHRIWPIAQYPYGDSAMHLPSKPTHACSMASDAQIEQQRQERVERARHVCK